MAGTLLDVSSDISVSCKPLRWAGNLHGQPAPLLNLEPDEAAKVKTQTTN